MNEEKKGGFGTLLIMLLVFAGAVTLLLFATGVVEFPETKDSDVISTPQWLTRDAKTSDISVRQSGDLSLSYNFLITPSVDIEGLEVTIQFLDAGKSMLKTMVRTVGNVKEDVEYTVSVSINEIGWMTASDIEYYRVSVSAGKVSYFA